MSNRKMSKKLARGYSLVTCAAMAAIGTAGFFGIGAAQAGNSLTTVSDATDLSSPATYGGSLPGASNDVALQNLTYTSPTLFSINGATLNFGTLNDLNTTQGLVISDTGNGSITLNTAANSVAANAGDLLYVAAGGNLSFQSGSGTMTLIVGATGNIDNAGILNLASPINLAAGITTTFTGAGATTVSGSIAATTGAVIIDNAGGTVVFSAANAYSGGTTLNSGLLNFANGSLGTGGISFTGNATLQWAAGNTQDVSSQLQPLSGATVATLDMQSNAVTFATANGLVGTSGTGYTVTGTTGSLSLNAANSFSGTYTGLTSNGTIIGNTNALQNATVNIGANNAVAFANGLGNASFGALVGGGNLSLIDTGTNAVNLTVGSNNSSTTYSGILSGSGSLAMVGTGTLTLTAANTFTGALAISNGAVQVENGLALNPAGAGVTVSGSGALEFNNGITVGNVALTLSGAGINNGGALNNQGGLNLLNPIVTGAASGNYSAFTRIIPGGTINLAGNTTIASAAGYLVLNANIVPTATSGNTTLTLRGASATTTFVGGWQGDISVGGLTTNNVINGTISDNGSNVLSINKQDAGYWMLSDITNSYSGGTTISAGTIWAPNGFQGANGPTGNIDPLGTGPVTLAGGTLDLDSSNGWYNQTWGPGLGYTVNVTANSTLQTHSAAYFGNVGLDNGLFQLGNLNLGNATLSFTTSSENLNVNFAGNTTLSGTNATINTTNTPPIGWIGIADLTLSGDISGTALTKTGPGSLGYVYANNADFTGGLTVNQGAVVWLPGAARGTPAASPFQFGTGTITLNGAGAAFGLQGSTAVSSPTTNTTPNYYLNNTFSIGSGGGTINVGGTYNGLPGWGYYDYSYIVQYTGDVTLGGSLTLDAGILVQGQAGASMAAFAPATNPGFFSGNLTITGGDQTLATAQSLITTPSLRNITWSGNISDGLGGGALNINAAGNTTFLMAGTVSTTVNVNTGTAGSAATVAGVFTPGTFTGNVNVASGATLLGGGTFTSNLALNSGSTLDLNGTTTTTVAQLSGTGIIASSSTTGNSTLTITGNSSYTGLIQNTIGTGNKTVGLTLNNPGGIFTVITANTYSGNTTVLAGTLDVANGLALQNSTLVDNATTTFDPVVGGSFTLGGLSGSGNLTLNDGTNAVTLTVGNNNSSPAAYTGVLSGNGSLIKIGTGAVTLTGSNTYTGGTTINSGILGFGNGGLGTGNITFGGSATLQWAPGNTQDVSGKLQPLSGATVATLDLQANNVTFATANGLAGPSTATITKTNTAGILTLNAANSFSGTYNTGTTGNSTVIGNTNALQNATVNIGGNYAVTFASGLGNASFAGLVGTNATGNLSLTDLGNNPVALTVGSNNANTTYAGLLSGNGSLTKVGTGALTFGTTTAVNTYSGGTNVLSGTLFLLNNDNLTNPALGTGNVTLGSSTGTANATIQINNASQETYTNPITVVSGDTGTLSILAGTVGSQTFSTVYMHNSLTLGGGAPINITNLTTYSEPDVLTVTGGGARIFGGNLLYTGGTNIIGNATLSTSNSNLTLGTGTVTFGNSTSNGTLGVAGETVTVSGLAVGAGATPASQTITDNSSNAGTLVFQNGTSTFGGILNNGSKTLALTVNSGSLTLTGNNTYNGTTTVNGGLLALSGAGTLGNGTSPLTMGGGTLDLGGANQSVAAVSITAAPTSGNTIQNGNLTSNTSFAASNTSGNAIITASLNGSGAWTKTGAGNLTFSTANTYSGGTTLNGGNLFLTGTGTLGSTTANLTLGGGALDLGGSSQTVGVATINTAPASGNTLGNGSLTGTSYVVSNASGNAIVTANLLADGSAGLSKSGAGILTLTGNNTYTGTTALSVGTININSATALGATASTFNITGGITDNTSGAAITLANNNPITLGGGFNFSTAAGTSLNNLNLGNGAVTNSGSRTITLNGAGVLTFGGLMTNTAGAINTLTVSNGTGTTATSLVNFAGGYALSTGATGYVDVINGSGNVTISGPVTNGSSTASGLTYSGTGYLTLSGSNTYTGNTTISGGTLNINSTTALGATASNFLINGGTINNTSGAALALANSNPITLGANFAFGTAAGTSLNNLNLGTGAVTNSGNRTITLNGAGVLTFGGLMTNTFGASNGLTVNNGTGTTATSLVNFAGGYALSTGTTGYVDVINGSGNVAISGPITNGSSTASGLTYSGSGYLTLSGSNTDTGGTNLSSGTLNINSTTALGATASTFNITGGTVNNTSGAALTVANSNPITLGGNFSFGTAAGTSLNNLNLGTGAVSNSGNRTITLNGAGVLTFGGLMTNTTGTNNTLTVLNGTGVTAASLLNFAGGYALSNNATNYTDTINGSGNVTITGVSNGGTSTASALTFSGDGTLTLNGNNTYAGATTVNSGNFSLATPLTTSAVTVNGGFLNFSGNATLNTTGTLTMSAGTVTLGGTSQTVGTATFSGSAASGVIAAGNITAGTYTVSTATATGIITANIIKTGTYSKSAGAGTLVLGGNNTYTGYSVSAGALEFLSQAAMNLAWTPGNYTATNTGTLGFAVGASAAGGYFDATALGTLAGDFSSSTASTGLESGASLGLDTSANNFTYGGVIANNGSNTLGLNKLGLYTLTLTGNNTYTGTTTVTLGTLALSGAGTLGSTTAPVNMIGGTLDLGGGNATVGAVTIPTATLNGYNTIQNGNLTAVSLAGNNTSGSAIVSANLVGSGTVTDNGSGGFLYLTGNNTYTGATTLTAGELSVSTSANLGNSAASLVFNGGTLQITGNTLGNFTGIGHTVSFTATKLVALDINSATNVFTVDQVLNQTSGGFTKLGAGEVILTQANTYTGTTTVSAGTLAISGAGTLGASTGNLTMSGGTLDLGGGNATVGNVSITAAATGNAIQNGNLTGTSYSITNGSGSAIVTANLLGSGTLTENGSGGIQILSGNNTYTGVTTLTAGTLNLGSAENAGTAGPLGKSAPANAGSIVLGGGTLQYSAANQNDYSGRFSTTTASQKYNVDTNNQTITWATPLVSSGGAVSKVGAGNLTISGNMSLAAGTVTVTSGGGTLILSGNNTYTGATAITTGALEIANNGALGTSSGVTVNSGALQLLGNITTTNAIPLTLKATGTPNRLGAMENLGGNNTYTGLVTLGAASTIGSDAGNLSLTNTGNIAGATFALTLMGAGNGSISGNLATTTGSLTKNGTGTWFLSGANTYTGGTTINAGALALSGLGTLGATTGALTLAGGVLSLGGGNATVAAVTISAAPASGNTIQSGNLTGTSYTISNTTGNAMVTANLLGTGTLTKSGAGFLTLSGNSTYTGVTTLSAGEVNLGSADYGTAGPLGGNTSAASILLNGGYLQYSASNNHDYSSRFTTAGNQMYNVDTNGQNVTWGTNLASGGASSELTKIGAGTLAVTGVSNYLGATTINGGTLNLGNGTATGSITNNTALVLGGGALSYTRTGSTTQAFTSITINAGAAAVTAVAGDTLTLAGITRNVGGTVDFGSTGSLTTTTTANINGILGGYATFNSGATWAVAPASSGGAITGFASYTNDTWNGNASNTTVTSATNTVTGATTNSLRFASNAADTLTLSGTNSITTGGILISSAVGNNISTITGGTLTANNATNAYDLMVNQDNTAGTAVIGSVIANAANPTGFTGTTANNNATITGLSSTSSLYVGMPISGTGIPANTTIASIASATSITISQNATSANTAEALTISSNNALTKSGPGTLVLSAANTFTGTTYINQGTLDLNNTLALQNSILNLPAANLVPGTVTFDASVAGNFTIGGLTGSGNLALTDTASGPVNLTVGNNNTISSFSGIISGNGSLIENGGGTLTLSGANTFTGAVTINNGNLALSGSTAALNPAGAGVTVNSGGALELSGGITLGNLAMTLSGAGVSGVTSGGALYNISGTNVVGPVVAGAASGGNSAYTRILPGTTFNLAGNTTFASAAGYLVLNANVKPTATAGNTTLTLRGASATTAFTNAVDIAVSGLTTSNVINGTISDNGSNALSISKQDAGFWVISDPTNSYSGGTTIGNGTAGSGGTLYAATGFQNPSNGFANQVLGTGPVTLAGGTLELNSNYNYVWGPGIGYTVNVTANSSLVTAGNNIFSNGAAVNNASEILGNLNVGNCTLSYPQNNEAIVMHFAGTTTLTGTNASFNVGTFTGDTNQTYNFGWLILDGDISGTGTLNVTTTYGTGIYRSVMGDDYANNADFSGGTSLTNGAALDWRQGAARTNPAANPFQFGTGSITLGNGTVFGFQGNTSVANPTTSTTPNYYLNNYFVVSTGNSSINFGTTAGQGNQVLFNNSFIEQFTGAVTLGGNLTLDAGVLSTRGEAAITSFGATNPAFFSGTMTVTGGNWTVATAQSSVTGPWLRNITWSGNITQDQPGRILTINAANFTPLLIGGTVTPAITVATGTVGSAATVAGVFTPGTFNGNVTVAGGATLLGGGTFTSNLALNSGAVLDLNGTNTTSVAQLTAADATAIVASSSNSANSALTITGNGTFVGTIQNTLGAGSMTTWLIVNNPGGVFTLAGNNTYTGLTTVSAGTLEAANPASLPGYATAAKTVVAAGATLAVQTGNGTVGWSSVQIDSLRGNATWATSASALGIDTTSGNFSYASNMTQALALTKLGGNTLTLTGTNTYTGNTTVAAGTLYAGAANTLSSSSAMTISGGTLDVSAYANTVNSLSMTGGSLNLGIGNLLTVTNSASLTGGTINLSGSATAGNYTLLSANALTTGYSQGTIPSGYRVAAAGSALNLIHLAGVTMTADATNNTIVHPGTVTFGVNLQNTAPLGSDPASYSLGGVFNGNSGNLAAQAAAINVTSTYTATVGVNTNTVSIANTGTYGWASTPGNVTITQTANNYANPTITQTGGTSGLSSSGSNPINSYATSYTLNFGNITATTGNLTDNLTLANAVLSAYQDNLGGNFTITSGNGSFSLAGANTFHGLAADGNSANALTVGLNEATPGSYAETLTFTPFSENTTGNTTLGNIAVTIDANITPSGPTTVVWSGNTSASWNTGSGNWQSAAVYADSDLVVFDDSASGNFVVDLGGTTVNPGSVTVNNSVNAYSIGNGIIGGNASLTKNGTSTLTLTGNNTYSGGTTVNAGTLDITAASNGLLSGSSVANYAALQFDGSQTLSTITGNGTTTVTGSLIVGNISQTNLVNNGAVSLSGLGAITAAISGTGNTTISSTGNLTVTSFAQASLINNGITSIIGTGTIGQLSGTGSLNIGNGSLANTVTLAAAATPGVLGGIKPTQGLVTIASGSTLDITNNAFLLNYGGNGTSPLAAVANAVAFGAGSKSANGSNGAIISATVKSGAVGKYAVGYADHTEISSIPTGNVEVAYTLAGDANLDGSVDILDYQQMAPHYDEAGTYDWSQGDFNHDGHVDILDYQAMAPNYDTKLTAATLIGADSLTASTSLTASDLAKPIGGAVAAAELQTGGVNSATTAGITATNITTAIPEPATLSLLLLGGIPLLGRRRRRRA